MWALKMAFWKIYRKHLQTMKNFFKFADELVSDGVYIIQGPFKFGSEGFHNNKLNKY